MNAKELEHRIAQMVANLQQADKDKTAQAAHFHALQQAQLTAHMANQLAQAPPALGQMQNLWAHGSAAKLGHTNQTFASAENHDTRTTEWEKSRILVGFRKHHPELADFVDATAKLMGFDIGVALSPYDAVTFVGRRKQPNFIWRVLSRKWQMDVQWIAGPEGGDQSLWVTKFGQLSDEIATEKELLEKEGKPIPPDPPEQPSGMAAQIASQQAQMAHAYQQAAGQMNQQMQGQAMGGMGMGSQSMSGQAQGQTYGGVR